MAWILYLSVFLVGSSVVVHGAATNQGSSMRHGIVTKSGISTTEKQSITAIHNAYRRIIALNATNMMKLVWDDDIAATAQRHADECTTEHDRLSNRWTKSLPSVYIGQNLCVSKTSWANCIRSWMEERSDFSYGYGAKTPNFAKIGHFTQLTNWHASRFGCGYAECSGTKDKTFYVCNYAYGQYYHDIHSPWRTGRTCADCPQKCVNGLCDCGGKICKNFGTIDLNTCSCRCLPQYSGDECDVLDCNHQDDGSCGRHINDECTSGVNIAALCPHFCGRC